MASGADPERLGPFTVFCESREVFRMLRGHGLGFIIYVNSKTEEQEHWKTRRIPQVAYVIDKIYNKLADKALGARKIIKLGDQLDSQGLLKCQTSWTEIKKGGMTSIELFHWFKNQSEKTFTTREIYLDWLNSQRDKNEHDVIREEEMKYVLGQLYKSNQCCSVEWLNSKGLVVVNSDADMFTALATAFENNPNAMCKVLKREFSSKNWSQIYHKFDKDNWIRTLLQGETSDWNPLVFYACANIHQCVISIHADETEEYRIYPDSIAKSLVKFGRIKNFNYVYLQPNRCIFDAVHVKGLFDGPKECNDCSGMKNHLQNQLDQLKSPDEKRHKDYPTGKYLLDEHQKAVNKVLQDNKQKENNYQILKESFTEFGNAVENMQKQYEKLGVLFKGTETEQMSQQSSGKSSSKSRGSPPSDNTRGILIRGRLSSSHGANSSLTPVEEYNHDETKR